MPDKKTYICPICNLQTNDEYCPKDRCPTVDARFLQKKKDPLIGIILKGQYKIIDLVGRGGMGKVYKGFQMTVNREVAIKVLLMDPDEESAEKLGTVKRFHREAMAASQLKHPNTIKIIDYGQTEEGLLFMVMEFLHGQTLRQVIRKNKGIGLERSVHIVTQICKSLAEAHANGIVHRDLKPDNIILTDVFGEEDFVKVLDFGISKVLTKGSGDSSLTKSGVIIGTPEYLAPEQAQGSDRISPATDMYSLGVILYEMLSGKQPFIASTPMGILLKHINEEPPLLIRDGLSMEIPIEADNLIKKLLAKKPKDRIQSAMEVISHIKKLLIISGIQKPLGDDQAILEKTVPITRKSSLHADLFIDADEKTRAKTAENNGLLETTKLSQRAPLFQKEDIIQKRKDLTESQDSKSEKFINDQVPYTPMTMNKVATSLKSRRLRWYVGSGIFIAGILTAFLIYYIRTGGKDNERDSSASPNNKILVTEISKENAIDTVKNELKNQIKPEHNMNATNNTENQSPFSQTPNIPEPTHTNEKDVTISTKSPPSTYTSNFVINIKTEPDGADIYIDNEFKGRSPLKFNVDYLKTIMLSAKHTGYKTYKKKVFFYESQYINIKMIKEEKRKIESKPSKPDIPEF